jgi:hypothetical protein
MGRVNERSEFGTLFSASFPVQGRAFFSGSGEWIGAAEWMIGWWMEWITGALRGIDEDHAPYPFERGRSPP